MTSEAVPRRQALQRRQLMGLLPALACGVLAGRAQAQDKGVTGSEIIVGQNINLQAGRNAYGAKVQAGIQACLAQVNGSGGVAGRRVVLRTLNDDNNAVKAEANARQLVAEGAWVLFGSIKGGPSSAVMKAAVELGVPFIGPMAGSPGLRRPHLANVERLAAQIGMRFGGGVAFKSDTDDAQLRTTAAGLAERQTDLVLNHGSASVYGRLIRQARAQGLRTQYWGVSSGSTPLAASLGAMGHGMVFSQIVPNPQSGKTALAREYQARHAQHNPGQPLSYGGLEGFMTAKALTLALRAAGANPSRASLLVALQHFEADLGGVMLRWRKGEHIGASFVDLALVGRDERFVQ